MLQNAAERRAVNGESWLPIRSLKKRAQPRYCILERDYSLFSVWVFPRTGEELG